MSYNSVLVLAGEPSGDALAAHTISHWRQMNEQLSFWGFGGKEMQAQGVEILHDIDELAVIGLSEAILNYRRLVGYAKELLQEIRRRQTKFVLLVDYPGFNLHFAKKLQAQTQEVQCHLLVSPQLWAWRYNRIYQIKKYVKSVLCLFRFETEMYAKVGVEAVFVGHPLAANAKSLREEFQKCGNSLGQQLSKKFLVERENAVLLLPGSRKNEIARHMDFLLQVAARLYKKNSRLRFVVPVAGLKAQTALASRNIPNYIVLIDKQAQAAMEYCHAAIACSGTATMECALFHIPFTLIYKTSWLTYWVGKRVVKLPYIGMVNVLAKKFITKEFIQTDMKIAKVSEELTRLLNDQNYRQKMIADFTEVEKQLESENPPAQAAALWLQKKWQVMFCE